MNNAARRYWRRPDAHQRHRSLPQWLGSLLALFIALPGLAAGDTLVLSGLPEPLALAEEKLLSRGLRHTAT